MGEIIKPTFDNVPSVTFNQALPPFKAWVQMAIPTVYDDSLSYAELLYKVIDYLNKTNEHLTTNDETIKAFYDWLYGSDGTGKTDGLFFDIKDWFNKLDVNDEIDSKVQSILDVWAKPYDPQEVGTGKIQNMVGDEIVEPVNAWLEENISPEAEAILDSSFTQENAAARSSAVGEALYHDVSRRADTACNLVYNSFTQLTDPEILNITNIKNMGHNTRTFVGVRSANINTVKNFVAYTETGTTKYPVEIIINHNYIFSKIHLFHSGTAYDINAYEICDCNTGLITRGYCNNASGEEIAWASGVDKTLLVDDVPANSYTVGQAIYREANTANLRNNVRNMGTIEYRYDTSAGADPVIEQLASIGLNTPLDMINNSCLTLNNDDMTTFLGSFIPTVLLSTTIYTLTRNHLYGNYVSFVLNDRFANHIYYGFCVANAPTPTITWSKNVGYESLTNKRPNFTPEVMGLYVPASTPFDPWSMPENSIYYGAPTVWFEENVNNPYITDTNGIVTRDKFEDSSGNLRGTTYQVIKYKNQLTIMSPYTRQYFFGGKTGGGVQYWATNSSTTEINNTYENTYNSYTTQYTGDINVSPTIGTDTNILISTNDNTDRTAEILAILSNSGTGYCKLGTGVFYISGLNMPTYSRLEGCGDKTQIIWKETEDSNRNYIIKMGVNTSISNLRINFLGLTSPDEYNPFYNTDDESATDLKPIGEYTCILFSNTSAGNAMNSKISNVTIMNCAGSGIKTINSTKSVVNHLHVVNCDIFNCDCGVYNSVISEFHRFTNINIRNCFYGAYITGGNIIYNSFTIATCHVSLYLTGESENDTHGIIANGEVVHCKDIYGNLITTSTVDNAYVLYSDNITLGEKISSCSFAYGSVKINSSVGVKFFATGFGTCNIKIDNSSGVIFDGSSIGNNVSNPVINNSSNVRIVECFTRTGEIWSPI